MPQCDIIQYSGQFNEQCTEYNINLLTHAHVFV